MSVMVEEAMFMIKIHFNLFQLKSTTKKQQDLFCYYFFEKLG